MTALLSEPGSGSDRIPPAPRIRATYSDRARQFLGNPRNRRPPRTQTTATSRFSTPTSGSRSNAGRRCSTILATSISVLENVTGTGKWLADVRVDRPLLVGEALKDGRDSDDLNVQTTAGLMAVLAADSDRNYGELYLSDELLNAVSSLEE